jgi:glutamate formiminotransferase
MNLTDFRVNSPSTVYADLKRRVEGRGARIVEGELIGLIPEAAVEQNSEWVRQLDGFSAETKVLERRMERPLDWP